MAIGAIGSVSALAAVSWLVDYMRGRRNNVASASFSARTNIYPSIASLTTDITSSLRHSDRQRFRLPER